MRINTHLHNMVIYKTSLQPTGNNVLAQQTCIIIDVTMLSKAQKTETDQLEKRPTPYPLPTQGQARWHCLHASQDTLGVSLDHPDKSAWRRSQDVCPAISGDGNLSLLPPTSLRFPEDLPAGFPGTQGTLACQGRPGDVSLTCDRQRVRPRSSDHKKKRQQSGRLPGSTAPIVSPGVVHMRVQAAMRRRKRGGEEDLHLS